MEVQQPRLGHLVQRVRSASGIGSPVHGNRTVATDREIPRNIHIKIFEDLFSRQLGATRNYWYPRPGTKNFLGKEGNYDFSVINQVGHLESEYSLRRSSNKIHTLNGIMFDVRTKVNDLEDVM